MKFSVIGTGKTGHHLLSLLSPEEIVGPFNKKTPPTLAALQEADAHIVFTTGPVMEKLIPLLLQSKRPVISGATGVNWPPKLNQTLIDLGLPWICSYNFSISMNLMLAMAKMVSKNLHLFSCPTLSIEETHHKDKKDTPSGTALKLNQCFQEEVPIASHRVGDEMGKHLLHLATPHEEMALSHDAKDRRIFAEGAVWAAKELIWEPHLKGLIWFEELMQTLFFENIKRDFCSNDS